MIDKNEIKGVCSDMCPEKERYFRESTRQVARFELKEGSEYAMDHKRAVKRYIPSLITPLPHEVRPEPVLEATMIYLLRNVMDLCDDPETNTREWYDFLSNRLASIRQDIVHQNLRTSGAVSIIEQCVRFHIHCMARMSTVERCYWSKNNTESCKNCLQILM